VWVAASEGPPGEWWGGEEGGGGGGEKGVKAPDTSPPNETTNRLRVRVTSVGFRV